MTNIDQFESVFRAADKTPFQPLPVEIGSVLMVTDREGTDAAGFERLVESYLGELGSRAPERYELIDGAALGSVSELLERISASDADIVCTHRNLRIPASEYPYSLGVYVDVMSQVARQPLLLMPHPQLVASSEAKITPTKEVMAVTDHLTGDHRLVSFAAHFTLDGGSLFLCHIEDERTFERYVEVIGKIPDIDTDVARTEVLGRLLKEPHDYVRSCRDALAVARPDLRVEEIVKVGQRLSDYRALIGEYTIDLLVMNTRVEDQLAMHGHAYALAVELRNTPMLLL